MFFVKLFPKTMQMIKKKLSSLSLRLSDIETTSLYKIVKKEFPFILSYKGYPEESIKLAEIFGNLIYSRVNLPNGIWWLKDSKIEDSFYSFLHKVHLKRNMNAIIANGPGMN